MRQILSGFLATAMIVSVASAMTFAVTAPSIEVTTDDITVAASNDDTGSGAVTATEWKAKVKLNGLKVTLQGATGTFTIPLNTTIEDTAAAADSSGEVQYTNIVIDKDDVAAKIAGATFSNANINGKLYSGKIVSTGNTSTNQLKIVFDDNVAIDGLTGATFVLDVSIDSVTTDATFATSGAATVVSPTATAAAPTVGTNVVAGDGKETSDVEKNGDFFKNLGIKDVVWCSADGSPVPMAENPYGIDKDLNKENGAQSGTTIYFMINDTVDAKFADDTYWKLKITKGDNAKIIKKVSDITKTFNKTLYNAYNGNPINDVDFNGRHRFVKVELNEIFTDDEYKCTLDLRMSPTSKADSRYEKDGTPVEDAEIKIKDFYFYVKNIVKPADNDWKVGVGGLMLNPLENDWNEVTYFDEDGDLAFMKFFADSDVSKFYAKLSTKWEHADYASYFNDQDAYMFDFVGSPKISATSRCDLQIYNPFINADGDETIDPESAVIYQVIDGDLYDVTDNFTYQEGDNGDMAFCTRTRFLGTYIICEKAVEEAVDDSEEVPEIAPEEQTPEEVTPGGDNGGKVPANTGKWA